MVFINYLPQYGLSMAEYMQPNGQYCSRLSDFLSCVKNGVSASCDIKSLNPELANRVFELLEAIGNE